MQGEGTVTNGAATPGPGNTILGSIAADRGSVSLVGLAVNQLGRITASTAVRQAGRIQLKARTSTLAAGTGLGLEAGGEAVFGANSITDVSPDARDTTTTLDANPQPAGTVSAVGNSIILRSGSHIGARAGAVSLNASHLGGDAAGPPDAGSRIRMESGASIDVSGLTVDLPASRNALTVKLQGDELKDRPMQRDGSLYRKEVTVDIRKHGRLADGTEWIGTPLADLRQAAAGVPRTVAERSTGGGTVNIRSSGDTVMASGVTVDVSGGAVNYAGGQVQTTQLLRAGKIVDISEADPNVAYDGMLGDLRVTHAKWGVTEVFQSFGSGSRTGPGLGAYTEGRDAGSIDIISPKAIVDANLLGGTTRGQYQRAPTSADNRGDRHAFDEMPLPGRLTVGVNPATSGGGVPNLVSPAVTIGAPSVPLLPPGFAIDEDPAPGHAVHALSPSGSVRRRWHARCAHL